MRTDIHISKPPKSKKVAVCKGMKKNYDIKVAQDVLRVRLSQMIVNEKYKNKELKIPIHLALGHEAIAVAVIKNMKDRDKLVLSHRNIHYNLARINSLKPQLDEYYLRENGMGKGFLGSMNLANQEKGIIYTSSILGNNLGVAAGTALAQKVKGSDGLVFVISGDGAMEEGSFYETMVFLKNNGLSSLIIVENNGWSLATTISERRCDINLGKFTSAFDVRYETLKGNSAYEYADKIRELADYALKNRTPVCIEVHLTTLGHWYLKTDEYPGGKYINYHAGPAPEIKLTEWPLIEASDEDPVFVLLKYFDEGTLRETAGKILQYLNEDIK